MERTGIELLHIDGRARRAQGRSLDLQFEADEESILDLTWGHPDPLLLDTAAVSAAAQDVLATDGWRAMSYGFGAGPTELREMLVDHLVTIGERRPAIDELFITAGTSSALGQLAALFCTAGDVVLVESPTYFYGLRIWGDAPVRLVGVPIDDGGMLPDALDALAGQAANNGGPRFVYTVPTHHNPTGYVASTDRRRALLKVAERHGLTVVEDDAYREVSWAPRPGEGLPPSMWSLAEEGPAVIRLGSFSKTLGPGMRVGYLSAPTEIVTRLLASGVVDSGGGVNHFAASVVGRMLATGSYLTARDRVVGALEARAEALVGPLSRAEPLNFVAPGGGYFVWVNVPGDAAEFVAAARKAGVACTNGAGFHVEAMSGPAAIRVAFSLYEPDMLADAGRRLARVARNLAA